MFRRFSILVVVVGIAVALAAAPMSASAADPTPSDPPTHIASTFDIFDRGVLHIQDRHAVSATVDARTQRDTTSNSKCDGYTTTYTITWTARHDHLLTSVVENDDNFGVTSVALNTKTFSMTPGAPVTSDQAPTVTRWFLKGTHKSDPKVCPRTTRSVNHVEIWVDGKQRHRDPTAIVQPPSKRHLAAVWTWRDHVRIYDPARVSVQLNFFTDTAPGDTCYSVQTEEDLSVTALGATRIIAVGERFAGQHITYQRGDADSWGVGVVGTEYFLNGTHDKSPLCPADVINQDRIEIYTDATSHHHND